MKVSRRTRVCASVYVIALLAATSPACADDDARGQALFQTCAACHESLLGESMAPDLRGILGRKAATVAGFNYSPALKKSGLVWDEASLRAFIRNPRERVPGTTMTFPGYPNPGDVDAVMSYLKRLK